MSRESTEKPSRLERPPRPAIPPIVNEKTAQEMQDEAFARALQASLEDNDNLVDPDLEMLRQEQMRMDEELALQLMNEEANHIPPRAQHRAAPQPRAAVAHGARNDSASDSDNDNDNDHGSEPDSDSYEGAGAGAGAGAAGAADDMEAILERIRYEEGQERLKRDGPAHKGPFNTDRLIANLYKEDERIRRECEEQFKREDERKKQEAARKLREEQDAEYEALLAASLAAEAVEYHQPPAAQPPPPETVQTDSSDSDEPLIPQSKDELRAARMRHFMANRK